MVAIRKTMFAAVAALAIGKARALDITITPSPPPGLGEKIAMFVSWLYYIAILACIAGIIAGAVLLWTGRDQGKTVLVASLVSLAILTSLQAILHVI